MSTADSALWNERSVFHHAVWYSLPILLLAYDDNVHRDVLEELPAVVNLLSALTFSDQYQVKTLLCSTAEEQQCIYIAWLAVLWDPSYWCVLLLPWTTDPSYWCVLLLPWIVVFCFHRPLDGCWFFHLTNTCFVPYDTCSYLLYLFPLLLVLKGTLAGILRGCGHQKIGAIGNFVAFYAIGLPLGICLTLLAHMGALGMWLGLLAGSLTQASGKWTIE